MDRWLHRSRSQDVAGARTLLHSPVVVMVLAMPLVLAAFAIYLQWQEDFGGGVDLFTVTDIHHVYADLDLFPGMTRFQQSESTGTIQGARKQTAAHARTADPLNAAQVVPDPAAGFKSPLRLKASRHARSAKVCIGTTTADGLERVLPWLRYHRSIGISRFYLFAEGKTASPEVSQVLMEMPDIHLFLPSEQLDISRAHSRIWNETWLRGFFNKPCNHALFVRQNLNLEIAIKIARAEKLDWVLHIDTDELLYPGGAPDYSVSTLLGSINADVDTVVFPNYEALAETDKVSDPFLETTLFKRNFDHVVRETYFANYRDVTRSNPNYFLTYGNGKSAARISKGLRPNGAHRFHSYVKAPFELKSSEGAVLHYTYTRFTDVVSRKHRCPCKLDDEELKKCFILDFDRVAFKEASTKSEDELRKWYMSHVVWTDRHTVTRLVANGLFQRIYTPQVMIKGLSAAAAHGMLPNITRDQLVYVKPSNVNHTLYISTTNHSLFQEIKRT
mmetsp:Transcript_12967/g.24719  ORF Transcript_12967/g.24719 Transcript_12967/m.24719 type:complete len:502 (-) Transcript_12967:176-1681(-)|eukprot:CAMPEP_0114271292 /NCGR_PEP_ID=MMETSP0058-20121206/27765_1 /TAXON_ID=36894 /ORGANISM="Pyramimonas parkeae, CCMP726" /LENGTH=501 /DNA_ID=CAMNT_0001390229 /DNA_START=606 /DNA_END=2111 /DNA_ORIENTATION=-